MSDAEDTAKHMKIHHHLYLPYWAEVQVGKIVISGQIHPHYSCSKCDREKVQDTKQSSYLGGPDLFGEIFPSRLCSMIFF